MSEVKLSQNEATVLKFLAENFSLDSGVFSFAPICKTTQLDRRIVRLACRSLARKGLTKFYRGLCTDDGDFAGAGYAATKAGADMFPESAP